MYYVRKAVGIGLNVMEFGPAKYEFSLTCCLDFAIYIISISRNSLQSKLKIIISLIQVNHRTL